MKSLFQSNIVIYLVAILFVSCQKLETSTSDLHDIEKLVENGRATKIDLPAGTLVKEITTGQLLIELPTDYKFVYDTELGLTQDPISTITCRCLDGGGCSTFKVKDKVGCAQLPDCRLCQLTVGRMQGSDSDKFLGIIHQNSNLKIISKSEIDNDDIISQIFLSAENELIQQAGGWVFELKEAESAILELFSVIYPSGLPNFIKDNKSAPVGYTYVKANLLGNAVFVPIPDEFVEPFMITMDPIAGDIKCKCLTNESGCVKKGMLGVVGCKAEACSACQMQI